jgi:hypothetical protein
MAEHDNRVLARREPLQGFLVFVVFLCSLLFLFTGNFRRVSANYYTKIQDTEHVIKEKPSYVRSSVEEYVIHNAAALGYNASSQVSMRPSCTLWTDSSLPFHQSLIEYAQELANYTSRVESFEAIPDLRLALHHNHDICDTLELHPGGIPAMFPSKQLSFGTSFGWIEPLLPPMRHPNFCLEGHTHLMDMSYMVHDFAAMCRRLKSTSRTILVDMGASLEFHGSGTQPAVYLTHLYHKFGFHFDHIYAYEVSPIPPQRVFDQVPEDLLSAYHWINVGVESDPESKLNPLKLLIDNYNQDDFIVVKLDIDTSAIEVPLVLQLLTDDRYTHLIDEFYFEHHVFLKELARSWGLSMNGSLLESLNIFSGLREKGIGAHSWV